MRCPPFPNTNTMRASLLRRRTLLFVALILARFLIFDSIGGVGRAAPPSDDERPNEDDGIPPDDADYEVVTTNYGWNTPSGGTFSRSILSGEFFNATLAHPRYNGSAWADLEARPDPSRRIFAFLDIDTCIETNYPVYGRPDWRVNIEGGHPRPGRSAVAIVGESCPYLRRAAASPALTAHPGSRLIILDCGGVRSVQLQYACKDPSVFQNDQVIVAYYSIERRNVRPSIDVGLPPPAIKPVNLTATERDAIQSCQKRKYLFSFQGKGGFGREKLLAFRNDTDAYVRVFAERTSYGHEIRSDGHGGAGPAGDPNDFRGVMAASAFAAAPRGDLLFSYRFSEILSAGAVPVVFADGWLPPYDGRVVDWSACAVFVPESGYGATMELLRAIPEDVRCEMQRCVLRAWDLYAATRAGWVRGLVAAALSTSAFGIDQFESA